MIDVQPWFDAWIGRRCLAVSVEEFGALTIGMGEAYGLYVDSPWRIISPNGMELGSKDQGQIYGLKKPVDAASLAQPLLLDRAVTVVRLVPPTNDIRVSFGDVTVETFMDSCGYEAWNASLGDRSIVAMGRGELALWDKAAK